MIHWAKKRLWLGELWSYHTVNLTGEKKVVPSIVVLWEFAAGDWACRLAKL